MIIDGYPPTFELVSFPSILLVLVDQSLLFIVKEAALLEERLTEARSVEHLPVCLFFYWVFN